MNCRLIPASQRSPFHATTISLAGMLLCIIMTLAVLVNVSRDPSGAALSDLTSSFNGSLQDHGRDDISHIAAAFHRETMSSDRERIGNTPGPGNNRRSSQNIGERSAVLEEEETGQFSGETHRLTDVNGPVFSHLIAELQRYCQVSLPVELDGQLSLDLHSQIPQSEDSLRSAIGRILKTCLKENPSRPSLSEFEIIVWAVTPATQALRAASEEAFVLDGAMRKSLKAQPDAGITIRSSGRIWTRPQSPRPLATIVVRAAKSRQSSGP
ncbi:MAG: hypothetical protein U0936_10400 [Planctomycetaceae bacterium]